MALMSSPEPMPVEVIYALEFEEAADGDTDGIAELMS